MNQVEDVGVAELPELVGVVAGGGALEDEGREWVVGVVLRGLRRFDVGDAAGASQ